MISNKSYYIAKIENEFDEIAEGKEKWKKTIREFYGPFKEELEKALPEVDIFLKYSDYAEEKGKSAEVFAKVLKKIAENIEVEKSELDFMDRVITTGNNYAYLRIAEGCSNRCTYCAIPYIRGAFVSRKIEDILEEANKRNEDAFVLILDGIEDQHNLGSIIRTAELCGVHGIIIPKRRNVGVTSTVYKCSAGAIEHMKIAKVTNINATIDMLKEQGIWIYGADIDGKDYSYNTDFSGPCALIIGSEGKGISSLTLKKCDLLVKIPMIGKINSLNASVAGGIMMYEVLKGRLTK